MEQDHEPDSASEERWDTAEGSVPGHPLARYKKPALVVLALLVLWQLVGALFGGGDPKALKWLHEDTFLVVRVDLDALMDGDLFESVTDRGEAEDAWELLVEQMDEAWGIRPKDLRSLTVALSSRGRQSPTVVGFLETAKELDLERIAVEIEGFPVATDDDSGGGTNARLRFECDRAGSYRLLVSELSGSSIDGRLQGTVGSEQVNSPLSGRYARPQEHQEEFEGFGPYELEEGDEVDVYTQCTGDAFLTLYWDPPPDDESDGVYALGRGGGAICRLGSRLYLMCDGVEMAQAIREGKNSELDKSMRRLLDDVDWSAEASLAFDITALPTELIEGAMEEGLRELGRSTRDARLLRDIEGVTAVADMKSDSMRYKFSVLCEDKEVAEDVLDGLEDAFEAVEDLPGLPRFADDLIESISSRVRGRSVQVEMTITERMFEDFFELIGMGGANDAGPGFIYTLK